MAGILIDKLKSLVELHDLTHAELLDYASTMTLEIRGLRGQLQINENFAAMASRPKGAVDH